MILISLFSISFVACYLGSILGLGGGFLLVPALHLLLGFDIKDAVFLSLTCILVISIYHNSRNRALIRQHRRLLFPLAGASIVGAVSGAALQNLIDSNTLAVLFGALLCVVALYLFFRRAASNRPVHTKFSWGPGLFQVAAGLLSGLFGVGGGILSVPVLSRYLGFVMKEATRISFFFIFLSTAFALAVLVHVRREELENLPVFYLAALVVGALFGAIMARRHQFSNQFLERAFTVVLMGVGLAQIIRSLPHL